MGVDAQSLEGGTGLIRFPLMGSKEDKPRRGSACP